MLSDFWILTDNINKDCQSLRLNQIRNTSIILNSVNPGKLSFQLSHDASIFKLSSWVMVKSVSTKFFLPSPHLRMGCESIAGLPPPSTKTFSLPWMACKSMTGLPHPFIDVGGGRHCESNHSQKTQPNDSGQGSLITLRLLTDKKKIECSVT